MFLLIFKKRKMLESMEIFINLLNSIKKAWTNGKLLKIYHRICDVSFHLILSFGVIRRVLSALGLLGLGT